MKTRWMTFPVLLFFASVLVNCSTTPKNTHWVPRLISETVKARRPLSSGADPKAGPGGIDYRSGTLPNERFDCESLDFILKELDYGAIRACLKSVTQAQTLVYRLSRDAQPSVVLSNPEEAPACVRQTLSRVPVPREIVFQSPSEGSLECYSSRLDLEANEVAGFDLPFRQRGTSLSLPLAKVPADDQATRRWLSSWILSLFWDEGHRGFRSKILPKSLCKKCLGNDVSFEMPYGVELPTWP